MIQHHNSNRLETVYAAGAVDATVQRDGFLRWWRHCYLNRSAIIRILRENGKKKRTCLEHLAPNRCVVCVTMHCI
jgi:hypothetical protein